MKPDQSLNELEITLRRLPGVMSVAFDDRDAVLHIQLHIGGKASDPTLTDRATRLALQFATGSVAVELNHWQGSRQFSSQQAGTITNRSGSGHVGDTPNPRDAVVERDQNFVESQGGERVGQANNSRMSKATSRATSQAENDSVGSDKLSNRRRSDGPDNTSSKNLRLDGDAALVGDISESPEAERTTFVSTAHPSRNWESATGVAEAADTGARSGPDSRDRTRSEPDTRAFLAPDIEPLDVHSDEIFGSDNSFLETDTEETDTEETRNENMTDAELSECETNESSNGDPESASSDVIDVAEMEKTESLGRVPRTRLLAVLTFPDTDELEVHLSYKGSRGIGRAPASRGVLGASEAAIEALRTWAPDIEYTAIWARPIENGGGTKSYLVATELNNPYDKTLHGLAAGASPIEAAARATLHALNRTIAPALALIPEQS